MRIAHDSDVDALTLALDESSVADGYETRLGVIVDLPRSVTSPWACWSEAWEAWRGVLRCKSIERTSGETGNPAAVCAGTAPFMAR